jgi:hypothetical protein
MYLINQLGSGENKGAGISRALQIFSTKIMLPKQLFFDQMFTARGTNPVSWSWSGNVLLTKLSSGAEQQGTTGQS